MADSHPPLNSNVQVFLFFLFVVIGLIGLGFIFYYTYKCCNDGSIKDDDVERNNMTTSPITSPMLVPSPSPPVLVPSLNPLEAALSTVSSGHRKSSSPSSDSTDSNDSDDEDFALGLALLFDGLLADY